MGEAKRRGGALPIIADHSVIHPEAVLAAHDALHKGDTDTAHDCLHNALCIDSAAGDLPIAALAHIGGFDHAFATACRKNGVRAAYILIDPHAPPDGDGRVRLINGGDSEICRFLDSRRSALTR